MKKVVIAVGVAGLIYYFFFYKDGALKVSTIPPASATTNGAGTLNNPASRVGMGNALNLGPSFAQRVPGLNSVS